MIIDGRGENPSKISAIDYREMCQIHETVSKISFLEFASGGIRGIPGSGVKKCCSDLPSTRAGGQDDGSYTDSLKPKHIRHRSVAAPRH